MSGEPDDLRVLKETLGPCLSMLRLQRDALTVFANACNTIVAKQPRAVEYATCASDTLGAIEALDKLSASLVRAVDRTEMLYAEGG